MNATTIWVISQLFHSHGHGGGDDNRAALCEGAYGRKAHPAFTTEEAAREYLASIKHYGELKPFPIELRNNQ